MATMSEARTTLDDLAAQVAHALGAEWQITHRHPYDTSHVAYVDHRDGPRLSLHADSERLAVYAAPPHNYSHWNTWPKGITVALNRGATVIAKEISRRLLTDYLPLYAKARMLETRDQQSEQRRLAALTTLGEVVGTEPSRNAVRLHLPYHGTAAPADDGWTPSGTFATVELSAAEYGELKVTRAPTTLLAALLRVLQAYAQEDTEA